MKHLILTCSILASCFALPAQLWQSVGGGTSSQVRGFFNDTIDNRLYVVGSFQNAGDSVVESIATWDGQNWNPVGSGTDDPIDQPTSPTIMSVVRFEDEIFVGGAMSMENNPNIRTVARWNGTQWNACGNPIAPVFLEITNGQLFALGGFDSISGDAIERVAKWDGERWVKFGSPLTFEVSDAIWRSAYYREEYYFAGNFDHPDGYHEIVRWDGADWKAVGDGVAGSADVFDLQVFQGQLFLGGEFNVAAGNPSNYLMAWDGVQWYNPLPNVRYVSTAKALAVIDGELYIVGSHDVWDGTQWRGTYNLARYDGQNFCSFGGKYLWTGSIASFEGDLYVNCGMILNPMGDDSLFPNGRDTVRHIAKWMGGDSVDICISQPVRVSDPVLPGLGITLHPNPISNGSATSGFAFTLPKGLPSCQYKIHDITGRAVMPEATYHTSGPAVEIGHLPAGVYFVELRARGGTQVIKLLKE